MEEKLYYIENLGCANCAAKMEETIAALPQVQAAAITFATRQLRITAEDPDGLLPEVQRIVSRIEADARVLPAECAGDCHEHHHGDEHHHGEGHSHGGDSPVPLLLGAGLFVLGLLLSLVGLGTVGIFVFLAAYLLLGGPVLLTAGRNLVKGQIFDENFLMSIATLGALVIGEFPEAVGVMLFYRVGEFFEERAVARSRSQIMEAVDLRPETVELLHGSHSHTVPAGKVRVGDVVVVRPGDRIPLDGTVLTGESRIDTAPVTGEPVPVSVKPGDAVISGCVNTLGRLTVRVEKPLEGSMVTRILRAVESAAAGKPRIQRFITRFARIYTPAVVAAAVLIAVVPSLVTGEWNYWVYTALSFLVMSCPCALVLSVPLAFFSGIGVGSGQGILFKSGMSIEALAGIRTVAMDKTGTLTKGEFRVQPCDPALLRLCACCEQNSTHPIAVSIVSEAVEQGLELEQPEELEELPGYGIRAVLAGETVLCGSEKLLARFGVEAPQEAAGSNVLVAKNGSYVGCLTVSDTVKDDACAGVRRLRELGIATAMLTGDSRENARRVAGAVGIEKVYARLLPEDKLSILEELRRDGGVMFVGDGINDAPVLAGADVGAAMGSGADAAIEAADVVYLHNRVDAIAESVAIARRTRSVAWQNVVFALAVKLVVMVLGLVGHASMWLAVFADSGVALLCVLNAVRLLYRKNKGC